MTNQLEVASVRYSNKWTNAFYLKSTVHICQSFSGIRKIPLLPRGSFQGRRMKREPVGRFGKRDSHFSAHAPSLLWKRFPFPNGTLGSTTFLNPVSNRFQTPFKLGFGRCPQAVVLTPNWRGAKTGFKSHLFLLERLAPELRASRNEAPEIATSTFDHPNPGGGDDWFSGPKVVML